MTFIVAYITHRNMSEAQRVCSYLLDNKIITSVNYFPIKSSFRLQGEIRNEDEIVSLVKTRKGNWNKLKKEVTRIHANDVPCIIKFEVEANKAYEEWIESETS